MDKSKVCNPLFNKQQPSTNITEENKTKKSNADIKKNRTALSKKQTKELPEYIGITAKEVSRQIKCYIIQMY